MTVMKSEVFILIYIVVLVDAIVVSTPSRILIHNDCVLISISLSFHVTKAIAYYKKNVQKQ